MPIDIELPQQYHLEETVVSQTIKSSLDGVLQKCVVLLPEGYSRNTAAPLLVQLHSWGGNYQEKVNDVTVPAGKRGWIALCVDYRGGNTNQTACASEFAIQDIVDAVHYMRDHYNIDKKRIYLCGASGGGHMALVMAAKHPELWTAVVSFVPITDLKKWYQEMDPATETGKAAGEPINKEVRLNISNVCGGDPTRGGKPEEAAVARSPITFIEGAKDLDLWIISGKSDNLVPYHHGEDAYKKLVAAGSTKVKFTLADKGHYIDIEEGCAFLEKFSK
ncbi:MAG: alpha/beta fold hydrolase [Verrucomicrobiota bacterium]